MFFLNPNFQEEKSDSKQGIKLKIKRKSPSMENIKSEVKFEPDDQLLEYSQNDDGMYSMNSFWFNL